MPGCNCARLGQSVKGLQLLGDWWFSVLLEQVVQRLDEEVLPGALELGGEDAKLSVRILVDIGRDWGSVASARGFPW